MQKDEPLWGRFESDKEYYEHQYEQLRQIVQGILHPLQYDFLNPSEETLHLIDEVREELGVSTGWSGNYTPGPSGQLMSREEKILVAGVALGIASERRG